MIARFFERVAPNPWTSTFLGLVVSASVVTVFIVALKTGDVSWGGGLSALVSSLLATQGWREYQKLGTAKARLSADAGASTEVGGNFPPSPKRALFFVVAGLVVAIIGLVISGAPGLRWGVVVLPFSLIILLRGDARHGRWSAVISVPLLFGLLFLGSAILVGRPSIAAFPAVSAFFLSLILHVTRELELTASTALLDERTSRKPARRASLGWLSVAFFLFGVVSLWPWLGTLYGNAYLWILIVGVLMPSMYLWGRLRQPRRDDPMATLARFNRLTPYIAFVLLLAIAVG